MTGMAKVSGTAAPEDSPDLRKAIITVVEQSTDGRTETEDGEIVTGNDMRKCAFGTAVDGEVRSI